MVDRVLKTLKVSERRACQVLGQARATQRHSSYIRDELLNREIFTALTEAKILIEEWRKEYNQVRPHSALDYRPPAPEAIITLTLASIINGGRSSAIMKGVNANGFCQILPEET